MARFTNLIIFKGAKRTVPLAQTERQNALPNSTAGSHWEDHRFHLPVIPGNMKWHAVFDSSCILQAHPGKEKAHRDTFADLGARSAMVFMAK